MTREIRSNVPVTGRARPRGHRVRAHHRAGVVVDPLSSAGLTLRRHRRYLSPAGCSVRRVGRGDVLADPGDQHRHLVGDQADVGVLAGQHRQAGAAAGGGDEQERRLHLDDGLLDLPATEALAGAPGQALEAGRHRRQVLGVVPAQPSGGGHQQAVGGEHDRVLGLLHPADQVVQQPGQVGARSRLLRHCRPLLARLVSPCSSGADRHARADTRVAGARSGRFADPRRSARGVAAGCASAAPPSSRAASVRPRRVPVW